METYLGDDYSVPIQPGDGEQSGVCKQEVQELQDKGTFV